MEDKEARKAPEKAAEELADKALDQVAGGRGQDGQSTPRTWVGFDDPR